MGPSRALNRCCGTGSSQYPFRLHSEPPHNTIHPSYRDRLPDRDLPFFHLSPLKEHRGPGTHQQKPTQNADQRRNRTQTNPNRTKGESQAGESNGSRAGQREPAKSEAEARQPSRESETKVSREWIGAVTPAQNVITHPHPRV